jgi:hypothetical protein
MSTPEQNAIGLGVAGNFAGHLEQAGEADDFVDVKVADAAAPKGLFPFHVPGAGEHFLGVAPLSCDRILLPNREAKVQIEPEVALVCDLVYSGADVTAVVPREFGAYDDCSIRRPGTRKISEKKNWGPCSKGLASTRLPIDHFGEGGVLDHFRLCSYLQRGDALHAYGQDSAVASYSYFHQRLLDWIVDRIGHQKDEGPLESIAEWLRVAGRPAQAIISIGATRYTPFGEENFLAPGDRAIVAVYDTRLHDESGVRALARGSSVEDVQGLSLLRQEVVL